MFEAFLQAAPLVLSRTKRTFHRIHTCYPRDSSHVKRSRSSTIRTISASSSQQPLDDIANMRLALCEAEKAYVKDEVPIGAILVNESGMIIASGHNEVETQQDCTKHAELVCLQNAMHSQSSWRLNNCILYCTLEPCAMCLSALALARLSRIVYAAPDLRLGACGSWVDLTTVKHPYHSFSEVSGGVLADESSALLRQFFRRRRGEPPRFTKTNI